MNAYGHEDYYLNAAAFAYMEQQALPQQPLECLCTHQGACFSNEGDWFALLERLSITNPRHRRIVTEAALLGSLSHHGLCDDLVIVSDDAGQFNILLHALCWIHAERLIHKMIPLNEIHRQEIAQVR